MTKDMLIRLEN